ncbi:Beta-ketoadipate enol-lactone hydrolase [Devosia sp. LC5]|uniref:3-oxoadipate enol-lactonase n=1 Tax=Devosia sp. LC5 TaxID=1502724 RepID=UPI0004E43D2E|nr:3-oxoadipate enol-lactonase [Devosia sp. LC5]KFC68077.1 Beta-ketoadipate enol-lactone hydrolase [Devosia sp. LC5]
MAFARVNGIHLHYRLAGNAKGLPLVLANSLGTDARIWDELIADLGDGYHVISYDKRGHGLSDAPDGEYQLDEHIDDLAGLLAYLDVQRAVLAGVSVGGLIAQGFALRHPQILAGLILCDTAPKVGSAAMWNDRIAAVRADGLAAIAEGVMARWFTEDFRRDRAIELAGWRNMFERMPAAGYIGTCATLRDADISDQIGAINVPTLVIAGADDLSTPPDLVRDTASRIRGARFEVIANCGHIPSIEQPQVLAAMFKHFIQQVGHD